jgi:hypothetical protein
MDDSIDLNDRKRAMTRLEQYVTVSMQDEQIDEAELMERLHSFNALLKPISLPEPDLEIVARHLEEKLAIKVDLGDVITSDDYDPWLNARKQEIDWGRWLAYKNFLIQQGRALTVIDTTDELTDQIIDLAGDPTRLGSWARRGLVLGDVQSGKTGTYLALFNKAADAGYRLFILLAGNTEVLRQQTQTRVDEAFIGRDSSKMLPRKGVNVTNKYIGVGLIRKDLSQASGMTTVLRDFSRSSYEASNITIQTNAAHPYVFVVKKNTHVLKALNKWLKEQTTASDGLIPIPVMMLDDESDYASINTKAEKDPTAINKAIRDVLGLFSRSSYVAFTATPFANIFIDHGIENDLFPRNFVYSLDSPSNYVGSAKTFGTTETVRTDHLTELEGVDQFIPLGHKSSLEVTGLPQSLTEASDTFLLSNAIRDLRGDADQPRSMLVNVSRFKAVQRQVFNLLSEAIAQTKTAVELHFADGETHHSVIERLRRRFEAEYAMVGVTWPFVLRQLPKAISDVRVRLFNSDTDKRLEHEDEQWARSTRMIAVGGDVLSRGLTLEGLCISYFYRRVTASDTLMQMGRWFGYRDGYQDLCRIWINADSADNYRFASDSIEELRMDLRLMLRQKLTPEDFGLAVRKHPGALLITARNKMKNAQEMSRTIRLAGRRLETTALLGDHAQDRASLNRLIKKIDTPDAYFPTSNKWHRWISVDRSIVAEYLEEYGAWAPHSDVIFSGITLSRWVKTVRARKFSRWDIAVASGRPGAPIIHIGQRENLLPRRQLRRDGDILKVSGSRRRLAGPTDLAYMLNPAMREKVENEFEANEPEKSLSERIYYPHLERPCLIVYPLGSAEPKEALSNERSADINIHDYLVALKVAIPGDSTRVREAESDITYVINTVAQQYWLSEFSDSDDDDIDD